MEGKQKKKVELKDWVCYTLPSRWYVGSHRKVAGSISSSFGRGTNRADSTCSVHTHTHTYTYTVYMRQGGRWVSDSQICWQSIYCLVTLSGLHTPHYKTWIIFIAVAAGSASHWTKWRFRIMSDYTWWPESQMDKPSCSLVVDGWRCCQGSQCISPSEDSQVFISRMTSCSMHVYRVYVLQRDPQK